ncbi:phage tail protein, partial [Pseudomonas amygdali]|nr:phage tail protein [Pseudomonas amygdali]MBI6814990.1 phage tail protein [Pseudomonas amygdali]
MAYAEQLQSSLRYLIAAGEAGRRSLDDMLGPLNGAVGDMTGAASELENVPFIGPAIGEKLQRTMRGISVAQSKVGQVAAMYGQATSAASQVQERMGALQEQASKAGAAINRVAGSISPTLGNIVPTGSFAAQITPAPEAVKP